MTEPKTLVAIFKKILYTRFRVRDVHTLQDYCIVRCCSSSGRTSYIDAYMSDLDGREDIWFEALCLDQWCYQTYLQGKAKRYCLLSSRGELVNLCRLKRESIKTTLSARYNPCEFGEG